MSVVQVIELVFTILGGLGGLILVFKFLETSLFRKVYAKRQISKLVPATTVNYFSRLLGPPTFINDQGKTKQHVFRR
jgi:hypothetical protein